MNILPTAYVYPLEEKLMLSKQQKMFLDNPRADSEINAVAEYIRQAYSVDSAFWQPPEKLKEITKDFYKSFSVKDSYVKKIYQLYQDDDIYRFIARMWIVLRYDDQGQHQALDEQTKQLNNEGQSGFILILEEEDPIIKNSRKAVEFSYLMSLLIHTQEDQYTGRGSFILENKSNWFQEIEPNKYLCLIFSSIFWTFGTHPEIADKSDLRWMFFPVIIEDLEKTVNLLDLGYECNLGEKLEYIASLLKNTGYDIKDDKTKLVVLVSIIELLVTYSPDFNRFNVEESINKQFQLKASTLIYLNDKNRDIYEVKKKTEDNLWSQVLHCSRKL